MALKKKRRSWDLTADDLPSEESVRRADYLIGLENNAVFRLLTYRAVPFWRRGDVALWFVIGLICMTMAALGQALLGIAFFCGSGVIFYLVRVFHPDEAVLDSLTAEDLEQLLPTRVGPREFVLAVWGVRTSRRWIGVRLRAARIAFGVGWAMVLAPFLFNQFLGMTLGQKSGDTAIVGVLLIAAGASLQRRLKAAPAHALPQCLRIIDTQLKRLESRDQTWEYHVGEVWRLAWSSLAKFALIFVFGLLLIIFAAFIGTFMRVAAAGGLNLSVPADIQGFVIGLVGWAVGYAEGDGWRRFVQPDIRRNYMELTEKVTVILRRENRQLRQSTLAQMLPQPDGRH